MSNQLFDIADRLADLYKSQRGIQISLAHQEADLESAILALTPADGWPGKNEEARRTARDQAVAGSEACQKIQAQISGLRDDLADTEGEIEALREQRDAIRWDIRGRMVEALARREVPVRSADTAIEDAGAHFVDNGLALKIAAAVEAPEFPHGEFDNGRQWTEPALAPEEDALPF